MRYPADMPELHKDQTASLMHGVGHSSPPLDLFPGVDTRCPGVTLPLL